MCFEGSCEAGVFSEPRSAGLSIDWLPPWNEKGLFAPIERAPQALEWAMVGSSRPVDAMAGSIEDLYPSRGMQNRSNCWLYRCRMIDIPPFFTSVAKVGRRSIISVPQAQLLIHRYQV
jgi:hypothetical protein